jgi:hypothetical protein
MISTETLSQFSLFNGLPESLLGEIAAMQQRRRTKMMSIVFREGETADKLHFLYQRKRRPARKTDFPPR